MKNQVNLSKNSPQDFDDMGGKHQAVYSGKCVVCGTRVYSERDYHGNELGPVYDPDWRGVLGAHSAVSLVAEEYNVCGDDVRLCANCGGDAKRHAQGVKIAFSQWKVDCIYDHDHAANPQLCVFHN